MRTSGERERLLAHRKRLGREARAFAGLARRLSRAINAFDTAMFDAGNNRERDLIRGQMAELADSLDKAVDRPAPERG